MKNVFRGSAKPAQLVEQAWRRSPEQRLLMILHHMRRISAGNKEQRGSGNAQTFNFSHGFQGDDAAQTVSEYEIAAVGHAGRDALRRSPGRQGD